MAKEQLSDEELMLQQLTKESLEQTRRDPVAYFDEALLKKVGTKRPTTSLERRYRNSLKTASKPTASDEVEEKEEEDTGTDWGNPMTYAKGIYKVPVAALSRIAAMGGVASAEKIDDILTLLTVGDKIATGRWNVSGDDIDAPITRTLKNFRERYGTSEGIGLDPTGLITFSPEKYFRKDTYTGKGAVENQQAEEDRLKQVAQNYLDALTGKRKEGGGGVAVGALDEFAKVLESQSGYKVRTAPDGTKYAELVSRTPSDAQKDVANLLRSKKVVFPTMVAGDIASDPTTYLGGLGIAAKVGKLGAKIPGAVKSVQAARALGTADDAGRVAKVAGKAARAATSPRSVENVALGNILSAGNLDWGLGATLGLAGARTLRNKFGAAQKLDDFIGGLYGLSRPNAQIFGGKAGRDVLEEFQREMFPPSLRALPAGPGQPIEMGPVVPPRALMPGPGPARPMGPAPTPVQQLGQSLGELLAGPTRAPGRAIAQQRSDMPASMEEILLGVAMRNPDVANKLGVALADPEVAARLGVAAKQKAKRARKPRTKKPTTEEPAPEFLLEEITPNPVEEVILPTARVEEALPAVPELTKVTALGKLPKALKVNDPELQALTDEAWTRARATTRARVKNFEIEEADVPRVVQEEFAKTRSELVNSLARARQDLTLEDMLLVDPNDLSNIQVREDLGEGLGVTSLEELQEIAARNAEQRVLDDFSNVNPDDVDYGFEIPDTREDFTNLVAETLSPRTGRTPTQRPIFKYPETPAPYGADPYELYNRVLGQEGRVPAVTQPNLGQIQVARTGEPVELTGDYLRRLPEQPNVYRISEEDALYLQGMPTEQLMRLINEIPENASLKNLNLRDAGKIELVQREARHLSNLRSQGKNPTVPGMELTPGWKDWVEKHKKPGQLNAVRGAVPYVGTERVTGNIPGWQARKKYPEIFPTIKGEQPTRVNSKGEVEWIDDARVISRASNPEEYDAYLKNLANRTIKLPSGASTSALVEEELPDFYRTGAELTEGQGYSRVMNQLAGGEASDVGRTLNPDAEVIDEVDELTGEILDSYFRSPREINEFRESQARAGVRRNTSTGEVFNQGPDPLKNYQLSPWYQEAAKKLGREPRLSDARYMMRMLFKEDVTDPKGRPWFGSIQDKEVAKQLGFGTSDQSELEMLLRETLTPKAQDPFTGRWMDPLDLDQLMVKRRNAYANERLAKEKAKDRKQREAKAEAEGKTIKKTGYKAKSNKKIYDKVTRKSYTPDEWERIKAQRAREANK